MSRHELVCAFSGKSCLPARMLGFISSLFVALILLRGNLLSENRFFVDSRLREGPAGEKEIILRGDNDVELSAYSLALTYDPAEIQIIAIELGEDVAQDGFNAGNFDNAVGEAFYGVLLGLVNGEFRPENNLGPGTRRALLRIRVDVLDDSGPVGLEFNDSLSINPFVRNVMTPENGSQSINAQNGLILQDGVIQLSLVGRFLQLKDRVAGIGLDDAQEDFYAFGALEGTLLTVKANATEKGSKVNAILTDPEGMEVNLEGILRESKKGVSIKKLLLEQSGTYLLSVQRSAGQNPPYMLKLSGNPPKPMTKFSMLYPDVVPEDAFEEKFEAVEGAILKATVSGKGKGGVDPEILDVLDPDGISILPQDDPKKFNPGSKKKESVKKLVLEKFGEYTIQFKFQGEFDTAQGRLNVGIKKPPKRKLLKEDLEPVPLLPVP